jgi:ABC-type nitrate/sulfonate/bicarbonate transport system ATPase subunit
LWRWWAQRRRQEYPAAPAGRTGKPNGGELLAGATPLANIQDDTRMMFQDARLLPWKTVIDNVGLGLKGLAG